MSDWAYAGVNNCVSEYRLMRPMRAAWHAQPIG